MDAGNSHTDVTARSLITTRVFDAPRELVFDAFTDPGHLARWWGPDGFSLTTHSFDMRPGGEWRFTMHGPDGRNYDNRITFLDIERPERIVHDHGGKGEGMDPVRFEMSILFEDMGGRTRVTLHALFPTAEQRDRSVKAYHADEGGKQTLGRLAQYLEADLFTITRTVAAPRALVWQAWTEEKHLARWWGPKGFTCVSARLDLRPGGIFHYGVLSASGQQMWGRFVFHEIVAPERLVFVSSFSDKEGAIARAPFASDWPLEVMNTLTLAEAGGRTTLTLKGAPINAGEAERAKFKSWHTSMQQGFGAAVDQLEALLARLQG